VKQTELFLFSTRSQYVHIVVLLLPEVDVGADMGRSEFLKNGSWFSWPWHKKKVYPLDESTIPGLFGEINFQLVAGIPLVVQT
jgi:hypothetical protein